MKKFLCQLILIGMLFDGISVACRPPLNAEPKTEYETQISTASPTNTATLSPSPTESVPTASASPEYAPYCDPDPPSIPTSTSCQFPLAEEGTLFCAKKNPYTLIFTNPGASFEAISEGFECSDAGKQAGRQVVTCTGPMASTFGVNVCDPACAIPTVQADLTECPSGYVYNETQGCCSQFFQPANQNCEVLILKTKSCVVDCSEYTKKAACDKNSIACEWNQAEKVCQLRR